MASTSVRHDEDILSTQQVVWAGFKVLLVLGIAAGLTLLHAFAEPYESRSLHVVFTSAKYAMLLTGAMYTIATVVQIDRALKASAALQTQQKEK